MRKVFDHLPSRSWSRLELHVKLTDREMAMVKIGITC